MAKNSFSMRISCSQRGAALLIMMLILVMGTMGVLLKGFSARKAQLRQDAATSEALSQAKAALIAYAVLYADNYPPTGAGPGHLMCPDTDAPAFDVNGVPGVVLLRVLLTPALGVAIKALATAYQNC